MLQEKTKYRLTSTGFCHTPGIIRWAENGYKFPGNRKSVVNVVMATYNLDKETVESLLSGEIPYTIDGDTVTFEK